VSKLVERLRRARLSLDTEAADRIEALEAALRHISELSKECAEDVSSMGAIQRIASTALAPEQDK
jgi:hypothetical protein